MLVLYLITAVLALQTVEILTFTGRSTIHSATAASLSREFGLQAAIAMHNRQSAQYQLRMKRVALPSNYTGMNDTETALLAESLRNESFTAVIATNPQARSLAAMVSSARGAFPIDTTSERYCYEAPRTLLLLDTASAVTTYVARRVLQRKFRRVAIVAPTNCSVAVAMREHLCRVAINVTQFVQFERRTELVSDCDLACHAGDAVDVENVDLVILSGRAEDIISLIIRMQSRNPNVAIFVTYSGDGDADGIRAYVSMIGAKNADVTYWRGLPSVSARAALLFSRARATDHANARSCRCDYF